MKDKRKSVNIILGTILVSSIIGNVVLYNRFNKQKDSHVSILSNLDKTTIQLQSIKAEYDEINKDKFKTATEEVRVETPASKGPSDPTKMLPSGMTLLEVKQTLDHYLEITAFGTEAEKQAALEKAAKELGTTYDEIKRLPAQNNSVQAQTPTKPSNGGGTTTSKPSTSKPSTSKPSNGGGSSKGISDAFKDNMLGTEGGEVVHSDPNNPGLHDGSGSNGQVNDAFKDNMATGDLGTVKSDPNNPGLHD